MIWRKKNTKNNIYVSGLKLINFFEILSKYLFMPGQKNIKKPAFLASNKNVHQFWKIFGAKEIQNLLITHIAIRTILVRFEKIF